MLRNLTVQNFVLIEQCQMEFSSGLCVLTGETGAGKSILLGALGLLLGERTSGQPMKDPEKPTLISGEFDLCPTLETLLEEFGILLEEDHLLIKRMIQPGGKNRCFINDQPASVSTLKALAPYLVEIHGQHGQAALADPVQHRDMLDHYAALRSQRQQVQAAYRQWQEKHKALQTLQEALERAQREEDYLRHIQAELKALAPQPNEETELAEERSRLMQAEKLGGLLQETVEELQGGAHPATGALYNAQRLLMKSELAESESLQPIIDGLERAQLELAEVLQGLEQAGAHYGYDPQKLEQTEERLFALRAAARKHHTTVDELANVLERTNQSLQNLDTQSEQKAALQKACAEAKANYITLAEALSKKRQTASQKLAQKVMQELAPLKMEATRLRIAQERLEEAQWGPDGVDRIFFEVSTNPGSPFGPLHKIASGGELSRFMLALKVVLAQGKEDTTLIFDEIDTGTSGAVADAIGERLARLGSQQQVMVITHLPQVAGKGTTHFRIAKRQQANSTQTSVELLDGTARHDELAQMLSGREITEEARKVASQLLKSA